MKFLPRILMFLAFSTTFISRAQTAEEIIAKHIEAVGGKENISKIKSVYMEGGMELMGTNSPVSIIILNGKGYKSEIDYNGQKIIQAYNEKGGWSINPMTGSTAAQPIPDAQYNSMKEQIYVGGLIMNYASFGYKAKLAGREKVNNVDAFRIDITDQNNNVSSYFIDPSSFYIIKAIKHLEVNGTEGEISSIFSNFQKTSFGYILPYSIETTLPQGITVNYTIQKIEINKEIDPKVFQM